MKITVIGHSHISCMLAASKKIKQSFDCELEFVQLHNFKRGHMPGAQNLSIRNADSNVVSASVRLAIQDASVVVLCIAGNVPALFGLRNYGHATGIEHSHINVPELVSKQIAAHLAAHDEWVMLLKKMISMPILVLPPPPPVGDNNWIASHPGTFKEVLERSGVGSPEYRLKLYSLWSDGVRSAALDAGLHFVELPKDAFDESGFLAERYLGDEPSHANVVYGERLLVHLSAIAKNHVFSGKTGSQVLLNDRMLGQEVELRDHPYRGLPDWAFWKQGVAQIPLRAFDPVVEVPFRISRTDRVATAGSCFAQHISRRLKAGGFNFMAVEQMSGSETGCEALVSYDFSARYGNVYTARQLLQLFDRAYGFFSPAEGYWTLPSGRFCDPFRPRIEADGYPSIETLVEDRQRHMAAVREMFEHLDVFVFTLGLTECWISDIDGAAYPLAPGVSGGEFDQARYRFVNFDVDDVVRDLGAFIRKLRQVNPKAKLLLTVSPVPLAATYTANHVLVSTTYSKSVLRVAAEMVSRTFNGVCYFPSYEIITGNYNRGHYFDFDLRSVTKEGVDHVMEVFMRHLTESDSDVHAVAGEEYDMETQEMMAMAEAACDEELLQRD